MSGCTPIDAVRQAVRLELTWWRQEISIPARIDTVGMKDEQSGSRVHGDGTQVVGLELTQWGWQMSDRAQKHMGEMGHKQLGSRAHGGDGRQAVVLELTQWGGR